MCCFSCDCGPPTMIQHVEKPPPAGTPTKKYKKASRIPHYVINNTPPNAVLVHILAVRQFNEDLPTARVPDGK